MELHKAKPNATVMILEDAKVPPGCATVKAGTELVYLYTDGMYAKCKDKDGEFVYVAAWTEIGQEE